MNFKYYSLVSKVQNDGYIDKSFDTFIDDIKREIGGTFESISLEELYREELPIIYVKSGGVEGNFLKFYKELKGPILLLSNGYNNSLGASLEILSFLKGKKIKGEILHGGATYIGKRLLEYKKIFNTNSSLKTARLGVIGKPSDWLIASEVKYDKIKEKTGIELVDIEISELINEIKACHKIDIEKRNLLLEKGFSDEEVNKSLSIYASLRDMAIRYNLDGLTLRCFDLLDTVKSTGCIALSFLNDEGIVAGCEGDIPSLISMYIINKLTGEKVFMANPSSIDVGSNSIILSHCTIPTSMCTSFTLDTHFESGIGIGVKGEVPLGEGTIFKLSNSLDEYFVSSILIEENGNNKNLCRTQIKATLKEDVNYFLKAPLGNHHIIIRGDYTKLIDSFFNQK